MLIAKEGLANADMFMNLAERLSVLGKEYGINITPYSDISALHFSSLEHPQQLVVLNALKTYVEMCEAAISARDQG